MALPISADQFIAALHGWLSAFANGQVSEQDWLAMSDSERSAYAGGIAGNAAMHHPRECYQALRQMCAQIEQQAKATTTTQ